MHQKTSRGELAKVVTAKLLAEPERQQHWLQALAAYLVAENRTDEADLLINDIAHELFVQSGELVVEVESAQALGGVIKNQLADMLKNRTGASKVQMHESIDPELIGGLTARTPDDELDISVRRSLRKLTALAG